MYMTQADSSEGEEMLDDMNMQRVNRYTTEGTNATRRKHKKGKESADTNGLTSSMKLINEVSGSHEYDQNIVWKFYKSRHDETFGQDDQVDGQMRRNSLHATIKKRSQSISSIFQPSASKPVRLGPAALKKQDKSMYALP